jgi:hypothetical protein
LRGARCYPLLDEFLTRLQVAEAGGEHAASDQA